MNKRLTLKITGVLLGVVMMLQILPVYAEGEHAINRTIVNNQTMYQINEQYKLSVEGMLDAHPAVKAKHLLGGREVLIPDVMASSPAVLQVKKAVQAAEEKQQSSQTVNQEEKREETTKASRQVVRQTTQSSASTAQTVTVAGRALTYSKKLNMRATAYTADPSENGQWGAVDALGNELKLGTVAVDPNVIPLGTKLFVTGYQFRHLPQGGFIATASDTGGAIKGNKIDIFVPVSKQTGNTFGVQAVQVYVLK